MLQISDALGRRKQVEHGLRHPLPRELFLEVPVSVNHSVVRLQVPEKGAMIIVMPQEFSLAMQQTVLHLPLESVALPEFAGTLAVIHLADLYWRLDSEAWEIWQPHKLNLPEHSFRSQ